MPYPKRKIGQNEVPAIGWGAMGISGNYGSIDSDEDRFKVLDRAHKLGVTHWDSADVYAYSEELLGKWFRRTGKRNDIFLATKFGFSKDGSSDIRGDPVYVNQAVESSPRRLGVAQIDLYYLHRVDPKVPIEDTVRAMAELVKDGKVKYIGLSMPSSNALRRAHAVHPISAVQVEYSPFALEIEENGVRETAKECWAFLSSHTLPSEGESSRGNLPHPKILRRTISDALFPCGFSEGNREKILASADVLAQIGKRHDATPGQVSLAWLLAQGPDVIPIPGTKRIKYLEENARAVDVKLTDEEVATIRKAATETGARGVPRYTEWMKKKVFLDSPLPGRM